MGFFDSFLGGLFGVADSAMRTNMDWNINQENLKYQRERNEIEDARYADETAYNRAFAEDERAYNRAFAEDEREYNRALQQQIFEREDTAIERQAESLSKLGINPLSQNMNGLGSGQAVTSSLPTSSAAPSLSSRGGQPLHNEMKFESFISPVLGLLDTINGIQTGEYNRDKLQLENDRMFLQNALLANELGFDYSPNLGFKHKYKDSKGKILGLTETDDKWSNSRIGMLLRNNFELNELQKYNSLNYKLDHNIYDGSDSKLNFLRELSTTNFSKIAEDFVTHVADSYSKIGDDFKKKFGGKSSFADKFYNFLW